MKGIIKSGVMLLLVFMVVVSFAVWSAAFEVGPGPDPEPDPDPEGVTSLETSIEGWLDNTQVVGTVTIKNVGEHVAVISAVKVELEDRTGRGRGAWVARDEIAVKAEFKLASGEKETLEFIFKDVTEYTALRVVSYTTLDNHPTGERTFISRDSVD